MRAVISVILCGQMAAAELHLQNVPLPDSDRCQVSASIDTALPCSKKAKDELMIFVSMSLPVTSLKQLFAQASKNNVRLIMRGLVNNSFKDTQRKIQELGIIVDIDPTLFDKYQITQVPTFVKGQHKLMGNVSLAYAKQHLQEEGKHGATFKIAEQSFLEVLQQRLNNLDKATIAKQQRQLQHRVKQSIERPRPVAGLAKARQHRVWTYDPSTTIKRNIYDHQGRVVVKAGRQINPLDYLSFGKPLILIDATDKQQLDWALRQKGELVLTKGAPLELERKLQQNVYFDQGGRIVAKFGIKALPARISQQGKLLQVEEVKPRLPVEPRLGVLCQ